uniref:Uncharacterized protein n=1 Tax=Anopheles maculatus TaxID=74869 RepID=A0A182SAX0_9DIPT
MEESPIWNNFAEMFERTFISEWLQSLDVVAVMLFTCGVVLFYLVMNMALRIMSLLFWPTVVVIGLLYNKNPALVTNRKRVRAAENSTKRTATGILKEMPSYGNGEDASNCDRVEFAVADTGIFCFRYDLVRAPIAVSGVRPPSEKRALEGREGSTSSEPACANELQDVQAWAAKLGGELWHLGDFITRRKEVEEVRVSCLWA